MPYKCDTLKLILPKEKGIDRRFKLTEQEKDEIRENVEWLTNTKLWLKYWVCRRTIQYIKDPELYKKLREDFKVRRKDGRYYSKEKNRIAMKDTRAYRHKILTLNKDKWNTDIKNCDG